MNKYEKEVVGEYELYKCDSITILKNVDEFSKLVLNDNKTFDLKYNGKSLNGNWTANDYGDWTIIDFEYQNVFIRAQVGREEITFNTLSGFGLGNLENVKFTKLK
ncbi:MAG: hypothetical protein EOO46_20065 [Flavobacterium sp.]|nr:MAG: hypothetical protein EOO46_20065 [Flavobacterium sp.]